MCLSVGLLITGMVMWLVGCGSCSGPLEHAHSVYTSLYYADTLLVISCNVNIVLSMSDDWYGYLLQLFWAVGTCFIVFVSIFIMPTVGWRYLLGVAAVPLLIFFAACFVRILSRSFKLKLLLFQLLFMLIIIIIIMIIGLFRIAVFDKYLLVCFL